MFGEGGSKKKKKADKPDDNTERRAGSGGREGGKEGEWVETQGKRSEEGAAGRLISASVFVSAAIFSVLASPTFGYQDHSQPLPTRPIPSHLPTPPPSPPPPPIRVNEGEEEKEGGREGGRSLSYYGKSPLYPAPAPLRGAFWGRGRTGFTLVDTLWRGKKKNSKGDRGGVWEAAEGGFGVCPFCSVKDRRKDAPGFV